MLNANEWNDLLNFLVTSLSQNGANDAAEEVRIAASSRVIEEVTAPRVDISREGEFTLSEQVPISKSMEQSAEGVGSTTVRAPLPKEACMAAIEVLRIRLTEPPRMSERISSFLERPSKEIEWRLERDAGLVPSGLSDFSCSQLALNADDSSAILHALENLSDLMSEA